MFQVYIILPTAVHITRYSQPQGTREESCPANHSIFKTHFVPQPVSFCKGMTIVRNLGQSGGERNGIYAVLFPTKLYIEIIKL